LELSILVDPNDSSLTASYSVNGGATVSLGKFTAPGEFFSFDDAGIDQEIGTRSFAGVIPSHRRGPAPVTYNFDDFSITDARGGGPAAPTPRKELALSSRRGT